MPSPSVVWFRRDLRVHDHEALNSATGPVVALFVLDPVLFDRATPARRAALLSAVRDLDRSLGALVVRSGDPSVVVPALAREVGASEVLVTAEVSPWGRRRDARVAAALEAVGVPLREAGSPYVAPPGSVKKSDGSPYRVFTPYYRAWAQDRTEPLPRADLELLSVPGEDLAMLARDAGVTDDATSFGETSSRQLLDDFLTRSSSYELLRNRPDRVGTSSLSVALKYGTLHPRTVLERLTTGEGDTSFARQIAWRDFNADLLHRNPAMTHEPLNERFKRLATDSGPDADRRFSRWCTGTTGFPLVDAGIREMLATGVMHNRVRLVVASFLVKDMHLPWQSGERFFAHHLLDADTANNAANWQWVAGCGVDPSPFFRIFNPVTQGLKFDPDGDYVRRHVPELSHLAGAAAHRPWLHNAPKYPTPILDHSTERLEALKRLRESR